MGDSTSLLRLSGFNFSQGMDIFLSQKICSCMVFPSYKQRCSLLTFLSQHPFLCLRATLETCLQIAPFAKGCDQTFHPLLIYGVGMECLSGSSACSGASRWLWIFWYMYPLRPRASPPLPHCYPFIVWLIFQNSLLLKAVDPNLLQLSVVPVNIKGVDSNAWSFKVSHVETP